MAGKTQLTTSTSSAALPKDKNYMADTVESAAQKAAKKKKGNPDAFGWDVFNQESLARAHDKRLKSIGFDEQSYAEQQQKEKEGDASMSLGFGYQPTEDQKDRLAEAMDKVQNKKAEFSRRRTFVEE